MVAGVGEIAAPAGVLIRPDGHVAWAVDELHADGDGLTAALTTWFGPAR